MSSGKDVLDRLFSAAHNEGVYHVLSGQELGEERPDQILRDILNILPYSLLSQAWDEVHSIVVNGVEKLDGETYDDRVRKLRLELSDGDVFSHELSLTQEDLRNRSDGELTFNHLTKVLIQLSDLVN